MKRNVLKVLLLLSVVCVFSVSGFAETQTQGDLDRQPTKEQRDRVRKRIEDFKMLKLTKTLDLDEATSAKLFPLINRYDQKKAEIHDKIRADVKELRASLEGKKTDQLKDILAKIEQNQKTLQSINDEEWAEVQKVLTIEQQAKFILFRMEFDRQVRKIISDTKQGQPGRTGKGKGGRP